MLPHTLSPQAHQFLLPGMPLQVFSVGRPERWPRIDSALRLLASRVYN